MDRRSVAARLSAPEAIDGGAESTEGGGAIEEGSGGAPAPAHNGRVYRRHQREPMEYVLPVYVPGVISPSQAAFYNDGPSATPGCVTPNLSPHYQDALPHGGFNPTTSTPRRTSSASQDPIRTATLSPAAGVRSNTTAPLLRRTTGSTGLRRLRIRRRRPTLSSNLHAPLVCNMIARPL
ncbi:hypothetical protein QYE76_011521 [Lolium multiflorum]|uniref:Uncharacterized protein n=1 Tax=Lolium multiflorum TaxID=4521 RepID=A0AAD8TZA6_LOLMU|nr:hypothetical protein QYE76_011521 [Lolium multiflorum]